MSLTIPVPQNVNDPFALSQMLRDITRRAVDGTVVPLFVDQTSGKVLIGTVVASGPEILQVTGSAFITGRLKTGSLFTQDIAAAGTVWAGSLVANSSIRASGAIIAGPALVSDVVTANSGVVTTKIILRTSDGKHSAQVYLGDPDSNGDMELIVNPLT